jgi:hypothetical protein
MIDDRVELNHLVVHAHTISMVACRAKPVEVRSDVYGRVREIRGWRFLNRTSRLHMLLHSGGATC